LIDGRRQAGSDQWKHGQLSDGRNPVGGLRLQLRIDDAVQVERWRRHRSLTQHHVDLPSMVRLVIEQMTACHVRCLNVVFALTIRVSERPAPKSGIEPREEQLDPGVFPLPRARQAGKTIVQNLV
jgi:hypothetical protein